MSLIIETPDTRAPERDYILSVVLGEFLGLDWQRVPSDRPDTRISLQGHSGEIRLPDILFQTPDQDWLAPASLPSQPLAVWNSNELGLPVNLIAKHLPVIYGSHRSEIRDQKSDVSDQRSFVTQHQGDLDLTGHVKGRNASSTFVSDSQSSTLKLPIDILGSAFFMLTRYEEIVKPDRDTHNRFPARASLAYEEGFLDRPIIDEYVEVLWATIKCLWPRLEKKENITRNWISCDVDAPYESYVKSWMSTIRKVGGDILVRKSPSQAINSITNTLFTFFGNFSHDSKVTFDWIMDVNERVGNKVAFYFIAENSTQKSVCYNLDELRIRSLLRRIHERGHEIGLHCSYATYKNQGQTIKEAKHLRRIMAQENIQLEILGGRQHYLRWEASQTPLNLEQAGLDYDATLSYADNAGFRCGTCREYPFFLVKSRRSLKLIVRPLVVMECSVIAKQYMNLGYTEETLALFKYYKETCYKIGGNFSLLWHNSHFQNEEDRKIYCRII